ncbi:hypothetical protein [Spiroplasma endosymbiont of Tiphia femorata]|uniref:hypothetical protein n=1 Tax=Spiroplasma endosymbiont of Tiphia femorata TaxID=3066326 RepID=UPI0030CF2DA4
MNSCFTENKLNITKKSNDIINLFNEFKNFNEKIKEDFKFFITIKEQIDKFLGEYFFIKNSKIENSISIVADYDAAIYKHDLMLMIDLKLLLFARKMILMLILILFYLNFLLIVLKMN